MIRPATILDATDFARIYNHYVTETVVTFEETPVAAEDFHVRMSAVWAKSLPWLTAEVDGRVVGYAYAAPWRDRSAYRFAVESSVYLDAAYLGRGFGTALYEALLAQLQTLDVHVVIGGITLPNPASVALHERFGFTSVARFPEVGFKFGAWQDVGYWQRVLLPG
jgi:phosphinothricin acetyltransferase